MLHNYIFILLDNLASQNQILEWKLGGEKHIGTHVRKLGLYLSNHFIDYNIQDIHVIFKQHIEDTLVF